MIILRTFYKDQTNPPKTEWPVELTVSKIFVFIQNTCINFNFNFKIQFDNNNINHKNNYFSAMYITLYYTLYSVSHFNVSNIDSLSYILQISS